MRRSGNPLAPGFARAGMEVPAVLKLVTSEREGQLVNLTESGASIRVANAPPIGTTALLRWDGYEAFCRVVWCASGTCGLAFERPIPGGIVLRTTGRREARGPAAGLGNIPQGQRRQSRLG